MTHSRVLPSEAPVRPWNGRGRIVVMTASVGGLEAVGTILSLLPAGFGAPIALVQHRAPRASEVLEDLLGRRARLEVRQARHGDRPATGTAFVAPPGRHLLLAPDFTCAL